MVEVRNDWAANLSMHPSSSWKEGDTFFAIVKEKLNDHEAIVTIKGQDLHVSFRGDIPDQEKVVIQITGTNQHLLEVQVVPQKPEVMAGTGEKELAKIEQILSAQGDRLTSQEKAVLKYFLEKAKGTFNEKLETIQALVNKKLPITDIHLQSIHEALHGEPLGETLTQLIEVMNEVFDSEREKTNDRRQENEQRVHDESASFSQEMNTEDSATQPAAWLYENEDWYNSLPMQTKDIIVRTVTDKLSQVTVEFKKLQTELQRKLDNITFLVTNSPQARQQGKSFIEAAIHTLDRAILQGEFMLFTDMATEKQLLQASSKLAEAKQLLENGKQSDALNIVKNVKAFIETLRFQPSDIKVKHFISEWNVNQQGEMPKVQLASQISRSLPFSNGEEVSARNTFEQLRQMGFHHEKDVAQGIFSKKLPFETDNIKSLFMRFMQEGPENIARQAEQAVNNITGQQLLSKFEPTSHTQTMFYQLPLLMQDQIETVNVYLNSRNDNGKLDWQNCSLYFLLETKTYGKIGILLQAVERNLTVTIKGDHPQLSDALKPLTEVTKENLEAIGYHVKGIVFAKMTEQQEPKKEMEIVQQKDIHSGKGYDVTI